MKCSKYLAILFAIAIYFPLSAQKIDVKKLEDYSKDYIARLPQESFNKEVLAWSDLHDHELYAAMITDSDYTNAVLSIERSGEKPRKDVAKWSDAPDQFGYFYDDLFAARHSDDIKENLKDLSEDVVRESVQEFMSRYDHGSDKDTWFESMKAAAEASGFCLNRKEFKTNPDKYNGMIADYARIIRVKVTGKTRTPDLYTIMQILGETRVISRLSSEHTS